MKKITKLFLLLVLIAALVIFIALAIKNKPDMSTADISGVYINEVMTKNDGVCPDEFDSYNDWIELYNSNSKPVDISGCGLSDDITGTVKYVFPRGTVVAPNGFLIVYCSGENTGAYYAAFKLSSSDSVVFYNQGGNPIECIQLKKVDDGKTLARELSDKKTWTQMMPSPGYPNTDEGIASYAESMVSRSNGRDMNATGDIIISEIMASNATTIACKDGNYYDWVELYNKSSKSVSLKGWSLSDDTKHVNKYTITDNVVIEPDSYFIVFCSGETGMKDGEMHVPFGLRAYEESFTVTDPDGHTSDTVSFSRQTTDVSLARQDDGKFEQTDNPTPGYPNNEEGYKKFMNTALVPTSDVYITELMGANSSAAITVEGVTLYPDYIELYNSSDSSINLHGYALSNKPTNPAKWVFPDITIKSHEYLIVLANSSKENKSGNYCQTNFSISSSGDTVFFFNPEGKFLNKLKAQSFVKNMSVGLNSNYKYCLYSTPTPGQANSTSGCYNGVTKTPQFSTIPGIYSDSVTVSLNAGEGETIYYTLDCTTPTSSSKKYSEPITISKNTVIRAKSFRDGYLNDYSCVSGTYLFTSDNCNHKLPVLTLVTDPTNLWDGQNGIYAYGDTVNLQDDTWPYWQTNANFWKDIEVPASFELFDDKGKSVFSQNIGINIAGAFGQGREQKGFAISARDEYGKNRMDYKFFKDLEYEQYKSLLLRCGAQDQANGKIRDSFSAGLLKDSDVHFLYQDYKPYVLYLNGRYWGVYFLREKRNRFFVAQHEGLGLDNSDNITLIKSETRANYGSTKEWAELMNYVRTHDLTNDANYKYLTDRLDIDSFIDYLCCEIYVAQSDYWNIQMYKTQNGKWKFIYYDFCWSWSNIQHKTLAARRAPAQPCSDLFNACLKRSDFRDKFIRRFAKIMANVFNEEKCLALIDKLYNEVEPEIARERSIFNTSPSAYTDLLPYVDPSNYSTYDRFVREVDKMKSFASERRTEIISQFKSEFSLSDSYIQEVFGNG